MFHAFFETLFEGICLAIFIFAVATFAEYAIWRLA